VLAGELTAPIGRSEQSTLERVPIKAAMWKDARG
jgi:hypothetical protein